MTKVFSQHLTALTLGPSRAPQDNAPLWHTIHEVLIDVLCAPSKQDCPREVDSMCNVEATCKSACTARFNARTAAQMLSERQERQQAGGTELGGETCSAA